MLWEDSDAEMPSLFTVMEIYVGVALIVAWMSFGTSRGLREMPIEGLCVVGVS